MPHGLSPREPSRNRERPRHTASGNVPRPIYFFSFSSSASSSSASVKNHAFAQALPQNAAFPERTAQFRQKSLKQYEHSWMSTRSNICSHRSQKDRKSV